MEISDARTRQQVRDLVVEKGPVTASTIARILGLTTAAVRRHLTILLSDSEIAEHEFAQVGRRGRGRPARHYVATARAHEKLSDSYSDLAVKALGYLGPLTLLLPLVRAKLNGATPRLFAKLDMTLACALKRLLTPLLLMATLQQCERSAEVDSLCNCVKATAQSGKLPVIFRSSVRLKLPLSRDYSMFMSNDLQPLQAENMCVQPTFLWQRP